MTSPLDLTLKSFVVGLCCCIFKSNVDILFDEFILKTDSIKSRIVYNPFAYFLSVINNELYLKKQKMNIETELMEPNIEKV